MNDEYYRNIERQRYYEAKQRNAEMEHYYLNIRQKLYEIESRSDEDILDEIDFDVIERR